nr:hypothetical protein CFP56_55806 [Quercus suber]
MKGILSLFETLTTGQELKDGHFLNSGKNSGKRTSSIKICGGNSTKMEKLSALSQRIDEQAFADGGQRSDIHHFRWMVAAMVTTAFPNIYSTRCKMSSKFLLFFSEIFTDQEGLKYYFVSQLYHPIFFNSSDRCNLIRMMRDLYNINPVAFKSNGFALPLYIRNLHEHFSERKYFSQSHEHIDSEIDNLFPGVAAAIIDSTIRNLHGNWDLFRSTTTTTLPYLQRTSPYGWCFPFYRFRN